MKQLDSGKNAKEIEVKLLFSKLKPPHASWLIELYNHFTSTAQKEIIANGWKAVRIIDAINYSSSCLDSLKFFSTIDPLEQPADDEILGRQRPYCTESYANFKSDNKDEWVFADSLT